MVGDAELELREQSGGGHQFSSQLQMAVDATHTNQLAKCDGIG